MRNDQKSKIPDIIKKYEKELLEDWIKEQLSATSLRPDLLTESELRRQSVEFLSLLKGATQTANLTDLAVPEWKPALEFLGNLSRKQATMGFTPSETTTFVFSFKQPLFTRLKSEVVADVEQLFDEIWTVTLLLDQLGLLMMEVFQKSREDVIKRQQEEMIELSTPVVKLWEHARRGFEMLKDVESSWPLAEIVYQHHERIDGSGYDRYAHVDRGPVTRYELPRLRALNFVIENALGGGVTISLALDAHGKSLSYLMLDIELPGV